MTNRDLLESWKDISAHLGRNARTCQRWEREFGLPVHRLEGSPRSRVYAYKDELDRWLENRLDESEASARPPAVKGRSHWLRLLGVTLPLLAAGAIGGRLIYKTLAAAGPHGKPLLAVLDFTNNSGDPDTDYLCESLPANLILDIQRTSKSVRVLSSGRVLTALRELGVKPGTALSSADVQSIVSRTGASHTVEGFVSSQGTSLRVDYVIKEARSRRLVSTDRIVGSEARLLDIEDLLAKKVLAAFEPVREKRGKGGRAAAPRNSAL